MASFRSRRWRALATVVTLIGAVLAALFLATPAWAHDELLSSSPAADEVLSTPPADFRLTFSENLQASATMAALTRDDGQAVDAPPFVVQDATIIQPFPAAAPSGRYTLAYRVASTDGHPIQGSVSFDLQAAPVVADNTTIAPSSPATAATPTVGSASSTHEDATTAHRDILVPIVIVIIGLVICAIIWLVSARRAARRDAARKLAPVHVAAPADETRETATPSAGESPSNEPPSDEERNS